MRSGSNITSSLPLMTSTFHRSSLFFAAGLPKVESFGSDSAVSCLKLSMGASNEETGCTPSR